MATNFSGPVKSNTAFWSNPVTLTDLPTASSANEGYIYYVSDALKPSESEGNGTGNLVFSNGSSWATVSASGGGGGATEELPHFTGFTNGTITLSSSATYGGSGYEIWRAFDSADTGTLFHTASGQAIANGDYFQVYDSSGAWELVSLKTKNRVLGGQGVATGFNVYGTNAGDGSDLVLIENITASTPYTTGGVYVEFTGFDMSTQYKGYRFVVTQLNNTTSAYYWEATDIVIEKRT